MEPPLKLLHTADVHLGARFIGLGRRGAEQRRQVVETFRRVAELAIDERVDAFVVAGKLFDRADPSEALIGEVLAQARRLGHHRIPVVILPGEPTIDEQSVYGRVDFGHLVPSCVVLTPQSPSITIAAGQATLHGVVGHRHLSNPLASIRIDGAPIQIGVGHGAIGATFRPDDIAASRLSYLALGHAHAFTARQCGTTWVCSPGPPELVRLDQPDIGSVGLVTLDADGGCAIDPRPVGRRRHERWRLALDGFAESGAIQRLIAAKADPDLMLDVVLVGTCDEGLLVDVLALERALSERFFHLRVRDESRSRLADVESESYPESTVLGRFVRRMREQIEATGDERQRAVLDEALRLGSAALHGRELVR